MERAGRARAVAARRAGNKDTAGAAGLLARSRDAGGRGARSVESRVEVGTSSLPAEVSYPINGNG